MKLLIQRDLHRPLSTGGRLYIDGVYACDTLEPPKPIPAGTYKVIINQSARFKRLMPLYLNVPGYEGVRLHWGNKPTDSIGCTLVGVRTGDPDWVGTSRDTFARVYAHLLAAFTAGQAITVTLSNTVLNA